MEKDRYAGSREELGLAGKVYLLRQQLMDEKDKVKAKKIFELIRKSCYDELGIDIVGQLSEETKNEFKRHYGENFF